MPPFEPKARNSRHRSTSTLLREIISYHGDSISLRELSAQLGERGFGLMLLLFAIPNAIPLPIPAVSTITSLPLIYFSIQLCLGRKCIWLPSWLGRREVSFLLLKPLIRQFLPWLERLEKWVRPRFDKVTTHTFERVAGVLIFLLACLIALPIPLGNLPGGIAITVLALAITERDGILMITGWFLSLFATCFIAALVSGYAWLFWQIVRTVFAL